MEALTESVGVILAFLIEMTLHAVVFLFLLSMAIFSPHYRKKLRDRWNASSWKRFEIVLGVSLYSFAVLVAVLFWVPSLLLGAKDVAAKEQNQAIKIEFSSEEVHQLEETTKMKQLMDAAGNTIKRKLAERRDQEQ